MKRLIALALVALSAGLAVAGCGGGSSSPVASPPASSETGPTAAVRPQSTATVSIVAPQSGAVIQGSTIHVVVRVSGASIDPRTTTNISGDRGHVHLYLDSGVVYMNYTLEQDLPVKPGPNTLQAEFVASDHAPFSPRVMSPMLLFTVG